MFARKLAPMNRTTVDRITAAVPSGMVTALLTVWSCRPGPAPARGRQSRWMGMQLPVW
ncbi:hypothetical protein BJ964_005100 [Actinoplanes lobatus]|uniref:Uncharacterized protein n=1 Tax=Actinoplanes lobatus TaxID=113568 RepID=A0A7W7HI15_9ACTN|nr:hypothetical protein [Actinoplanes lobatus]